MKRMHYLWRTRTLMVATGSEWVSVKLRVRVEDSEKIIVELFKDDSTSTVLLAETLGVDKVENKNHG